MKKHARSLVRVVENEFGRDAAMTGVEVGVWKGELSADLLRHFPELTLIMVDLWQAEDQGKSMHDKDSSQDAMQQAMAEAWENTEFADERRLIVKGESTVLAEEAWNKSMHFIFLDADHFYESVRADLLAWFVKVREGGIIAGHDYNGQGDRRKGWGVKRAVDEFFGTLKLEVNVEPGLVWWCKKW